MIDPIRIDRYTLSKSTERVSSRTGEVRREYISGELVQELFFPSTSFVIDSETVGTETLAIEESNDFLRSQTITRNETETIETGSPVVTFDDGTVLKTSTDATQYLYYDFTDRDDAVVIMYDVPHNDSVEFDGEGFDGQVRNLFSVPSVANDFVQALVTTELIYGDPPDTAAIVRAFVDDSGNFVSLNAWGYHTESDVETPTGNAYQMIRSSSASIYSNSINVAAIALNTTNIAFNWRKQLSNSVDVDGVETYQTIKPLKLDLQAEVTIRHDRETNDYLLRGGDITIELFSKSGTTETVEFTRTFSVEITSEPFDPEFAYGDLYVGHVWSKFKSTGTGGDLIHEYFRYDGVSEEYSSPWSSVQSNTYKLNVRPSYVDMTPGSRPEFLYSGNQQTPTEFRLTDELTSRLYLRVIVSEPKLIAAINFFEIENAEHTRADTCLREETCEYTPRKNSPQWAFESAALGSGLVFAEITDDQRGHNRCQSGIGRAGLYRNQFMQVTVDMSYINWYGIYADGSRRYDPIHQYRTRATGTDELLITPHLWINSQIRISGESETEYEITAEAQVHAPRANAAFGVSWTGTPVSGSTQYLVLDSLNQWNDFGVPFSDAYDLADLNWEEELHPVNQFKRTQIATRSWNTLAFGAEPAHVSIPATNEGSPLVSIDADRNSVTKITEFRVELASPYKPLMFGRSVLDTPSFNVQWRKWVPKWTGLVPPAVAFSAADIVSPATESRTYETLRSLGVQDTAIYEVPYNVVPNGALKFETDYTTGDLNDFTISFVPATDAIEV